MDLVPRLLFLLGIGFFVANLRLLVQFVRFLRLRSTAVLTWPAGRPRYAIAFAVLGGALAVLILVKLAIQQRPPADAFGESMMLLYYGYAAPMSWRIGRGFYREGIWAESGFMRYSEIGGMSWREGEEVTLLLIPRVRRMVRRLVVPTNLYGQARRLLHDRVAAHEIQFAKRTLDLGGHDEREDI